MRKGWKRVPLSELLTKRTDFTPIEDGVSYRCAGVQRSGWGIIERDPFVGGVSKFSKLMRLEKDNFVYRVITAFEAPSAVVDDDSADMYVSPQTFPVFRVNETFILPAYLKILTTAPSFHHEMAERCTGSVLRRMTLSVGAFLSIPINLPPVEEQQRIVDLIGSLDDVIDAADEAAKAARGTTAELRANHFEGSRSGWGSIEELADVIIGKQKNTNGDSQLSAPYLRAANLSGGQLDVSDISTMPFTTTERRRMGVEIGDVLIVEGGGGYGHSAMWLGTEHPFVGIQNSILRLRARENRSLPAYLLHWAKWARESGYFDDSMTSTTIPHLSLARVKGMTIPAVTFAEQKHLVTAMDAALSVADSASTYATSLRTLRSDLLTVLLPGEHEIPESYDALLTPASQLEPAA